MFWNVSAKRYQCKVTVEGEAGMSGEPVDVDVHKMHTTVKAVKLVVHWSTAIRSLEELLDQQHRANPAIFPFGKMDGMVPLQPPTSDQSGVVPVELCRVLDNQVVAGTLVGLDHESFRQGLAASVRQIGADPEQFGQHALADPLLDVFRTATLSAKQV